MTKMYEYSVYRGVYVYEKSNNIVVTGTKGGSPLRGSFRPINYGYNGDIVDVPYYPSFAFSTDRGYYGTGTPIIRKSNQNPVVGYYTSYSAGPGDLLEIYSETSTVDIPLTANVTFHHYMQHRVKRDFIMGTELMGTFIDSYDAYEDGALSYNTPYGTGFVVRGEEVPNLHPSISLETPNNRTLYETDTYTIEGTSKDADAGNVVTVRYQINALPSQAIATHIADGTDKFFSKSLTFKEGKLFDGSTALTGVLTEGTQYSVKVWAEDDKGGKSAVQTRYFYVVPNRPANLTIDPLTTKTGLIDSDSVTISGNVSDPDNNTVTVKYKIGNQAYTEVYSGNGGAFSFEVPLNKLNAGNNTLTIRATDSYGVTTDKVISVEKSGTSIPLKQSVARYKLTPPNGTASGIILWISREVGDLIVSARASMVMNGEAEVFQDMTLSGTAFLSDGTEEDEYILDGGEPKDNITLEITMLRTSTASNKGIKLISGVLN